MVRLYRSLVLAALCAGCSLPIAGLMAADDDGGADGGERDAAAGDAGMRDGGNGDAGEPPEDAGAMDAGGMDAGPGDAGPPMDAGEPPPDWYDIAWAERRRLTFDNAPHALNLDDFPVLVTLNASRIAYAAAGPDGASLRFTDPDGSLLDHEVERWDPAGTSHVWVRVPRIDASSNTDFIWMYTDSPGASDAQDADATWGSIYRAVWHMNGDMDDASGRSNHGSTSTAGNIDGVIGGAREFDSVGDRSVVSDDSTLDLNTALMISAWMRPDTFSHHLALLAKRESCGDESNYAVFVQTDRQVRFEHYDGDWRIFSGGALTTGTWHWVVATATESSDRVRLFVDGAVVGSFASSRNLRPDNRDIEIGSNGGCGSFMEGGLDEVRIESISRSNIWIAAQYRSMTDAYLTYGAAERIR